MVPHIINNMSSKSSYPAAYRNGSAKLESNYQSKVQVIPVLPSQSRRMPWFTLSKSIQENQQVGIFFVLVRVIPQSNQTASVSNLGLKLI